MLFTKKILLTIVACLSIGFVFLGASGVWASAVTDGLSEAAGVAELPKKVAGTDSIVGLIGVVIGLALSVVASIFFLLILYAGANWMMAMGNSERVSKAKETLETAAIGLVIVLAAYAIASFVFGVLKPN